MFTGPDPMGFVWGGVGRALVHFMHFSAIFAMLAVLATSVTHATHPEGCEWGCCGSICLRGYERMFFAVCSLADGQSKRVPKTRNDCLHE